MKHARGTNKWPEFPLTTCHTQSGQQCANLVQHHAQNKPWNAGSTRADKNGQSCFLPRVTVRTIASGENTEGTRGAFVQSKGIKNGESFPLPCVIGRALPRGRDAGSYLSREKKRKFCFRGVANLAPNGFSTRHRANRGERTVREAKTNG